MNIMPTLKIKDIVKDPSKLKAKPRRNKITIFNFISEFFSRRKLEKHLEEVRKQLYNPKEHINNSHIFFNFKSNK